MKDPRSTTANRNVNKSEHNAGATYEVGYGKPPSASRFRAGRSGNPKGRPKGHRNFKTIIQEALNAPVLVREGGKKRHVKKVEAIVLRQLDGAMKGDGRATETVIKLMKHMGLLDTLEPEAASAKLTSAEERIFEEIVQQGHSRKTRAR